jgi:hypothetical protein
VNRGKQIGRTRPRRWPSAGPANLQIMTRHLDPDYQVATHLVRGETDSGGGGPFAI